MQQISVTKKRLKEPNKDNFTPVGGKLDPFEETGVKVDTMKYCGILTETSPTEYNWIGYVYIVDIDFVEPPNCNEGTLMWIDFEDLLKEPTPKTDWYVYKYILDDKLNILSMTEEIENKIIL